MAPRTETSPKRDSAASAPVQPAFTASNPPTMAAANGSQKPKNSSGYSAERLAAVAAFQAKKAAKPAQFSTTSVNEKNTLISAPTIAVTPINAVGASISSNSVSGAMATGTVFQPNVSGPTVSRPTESAIRPSRDTGVVRPSFTSAVPAPAPVSIAKPKRPAKAAKAGPPTRSDLDFAHGRREHESMLEFVDAARKVGGIREDILQQMSVPWQEKGELEMTWKEEDLLGKEYGIVRDAIMPLKQAEAIAAKKDAEQKAFLRRWANGEINEDGNELIDDVEVVEVRAKYNSTTAGRVIKKSVSLASPSHTSSPLSSRPLSSPTVVTSPMKKLAARKAALPMSAKPKPATPRKEKYSSSIPPLKELLHPVDGLPDYTEFNYNELAAICSERNLMAGGPTLEIRNRLILDDLYVKFNLEHKREFKTYKRGRKRERKTKAPVVPNAPVAGKMAKRKRDLEDGEEKTGGQLKKARAG
ncbi:hypothetical protein CC80DRAFT_542602 [Byssothecium circinans]|uniref:Uncharacterized protein n=1 Tax=Byssothecium circinans TaxID=147558 RepID=A0A6A5UH87_9PLEO|nr:hypothetical protein CC80DRAFT_542602 [Byssothecium circinans]